MKTLSYICAGLLFATKAVGFPSDSSLSLLTLNVRYGTAEDGPNHWSFRKGSVARYLQSKQADVLALQEALPFQVSELSTSLPNYTVITRSRDVSSETGEACPILFDSDKWAALQFGTFWLSDTPHKPGSATWGNTLPRIATWAILRNRATGSTIHVVNTHLDYASTHAQQRSIEVLLQHFSTPNVDIAASFLVGDLNIEESNNAWIPMRQSTMQWKDVWRFLWPTQQQGTWHDWTGRSNDMRIDYILVSGQRYRPVHAEIDQQPFEGRFLSDHFPVSAVFEDTNKTDQNLGDSKSLSRN